MKAGDMKMKAAEVEAAQTRFGSSRPGALAAAVLLATLLLALPAAASAAGPPVITDTGFSAVSTTSATLEATLNPNGAKTTPYHFEYVDQASFKASGFAAAQTTPDGPALNGTADIPVAATIGGLEPATTYHFRLFAHNTKGDTTGEAITFATYPQAPIFGPCPNEAFRSGEFAAPGHPSALLPDCRAYEQVSPVDKNGGDATGMVGLAKASVFGDGAVFGSSFSIPGGEGAQEIPTYQGIRGTAGWSSFGQLPPPSFGENAFVLGWLPDFSKTFVSVLRQGNPSLEALLQRSGDGSPPARITPYVAEARFAYDGASAGGGKVAFEAHAQLPPEEGSPPIALARPSSPNVYVYDEGTGRVALASVLNTAAQTEATLPKGAFAGPYDWGIGTSATNLSENEGAYYLQDNHAVSADGSVYFTAAGSGRLYQRANPTEPQSVMETVGGEEVCSKPDKACTYHLSRSRRTPPDPAGSAPAAFQAASADGATAYFTSPEKLTADANTGHDQPAAKIGRSKLDGVTELKPDWLPRRAVGVAVDAEYIYWADPADGTIGRAELDGGNPDPSFIEPGPSFWEEEVETSPGSEEFETISGEPPAKPRYVAVDSGHIYWTNTADGNRHHGTIGRATINGKPESVEPECITGASNPQGIAVNATNIYWANAGISDHEIGRADIDCKNAQPDFYLPFDPSPSPQGVALTSTHLYWSAIELGDPRHLYSIIHRIPLQGLPDPHNEEFGQIEEINSQAEPIDPVFARGIAVVGEDVYWAGQGREAIGHAVWPDAQEKPTTIEREFIKLDGSPIGIAADAEHLYWSTNGESEPNPGNDLYRFRRPGTGGCADPTGCLDDLIPDSTDPNGIEVQGVVGASQDGSRLYFVANADLDGSEPAQPGNCKGPPKEARGQCNLYLWDQGSISFVAGLNANGSPGVSDMLNWTPTQSLGSSQRQKISRASADGRTLLFRSQQQLTGYENDGDPELYLHREGEPLACLSCNPTGAAQSSIELGSYFGAVRYPTLTPVLPSAQQTRALSADGDRAVFQTPEALVAADTDGAAGCPRVGSILQAYNSCTDVYEWEAPGAGSCTLEGPGYSPANDGCLYLLTPGDSAKPSLLADASGSGNDVFLFTPEPLVGQDQDDLFDLYDVRVDGGLASQNPTRQAPSCEAEGCKPASSSAPQVPGPASAGFQGPPNPKPKKQHKKHHKRHKKHHKRHKKHHKRHTKGATHYDSSNPTRRSR
jgi:hypothetical protein